MISDYKIKKLSPQFLVEDINRAIDFYKKNLGFEVEFVYEDFYCGIVKDGCSIHLKLSDTIIRRKRSSNEDLDVIISTEAIENLYENFKSTTVEIVQPLRMMPYGKEFYIADPDGNTIAFLHERN